MGNPYVPVSQLLSLADDPEIRRTRKNLRILLGVLLVLTVLGTISSITGNGIVNNSKYSSRGTEIAQSIISVLFLSFGYLAAQRYSKIGLRVFAWLNIIELVIMGIVLAILVICGLVVVRAASSAANGEQKGILVLSIVVVVVIIAVIIGLILQGAAVLGVLGAIASIVSNDVQYGSKYSIRQTGIGQSLISLLLYSFGYLVAYRYSQTGLRVFAWINIFALASAGIGLVVRMIFGFLVLTTPTSTDHGQLILAS
ncbi:unnamed protein product [Rotaria socialis]|uniref:Uncharacterized protein n=1 Tax=Rotaria socialis TaxID=392032 RepID=A0A820R7N2_9BILA|nr:unnamed protein product [Rotaria socialis]CAF4430920.1 unnamed protein product [Rotaria socialis]